MATLPRVYLEVPKTAPKGILNIDCCILEVAGEKVWPLRESDMVLGSNPIQQ